LAVLLPLSGELIFGVLNVTVHFVNFTACGSLWKKNKSVNIFYANRHKNVKQKMK